MPKYRVQYTYTTYETYIIDADNEDEAKDYVFSGDLALKPVSKELGDESIIADLVEYNNA